ncbi:MAG: sensor domain-containing diguanylate cyclase [Actinobacteria bacterium]|nr:sensor domain-containing diguanylate cyclase [Actinomycetota bacterium]
MRITRKVFHDLAIWQVGFGLCIGLVFPPFVMLLGVPRDTALTPQFFAACLFAGALSGVVNYVISRRVVGARLRILAERMTHVEQSLGSMTSSGDLSGCTPAECSIVVDSEDEIGESALAFNRLVEALSASMRTQLAVRSFSEMLTSQLEIESLAHEALRQFFEHAGAAGGLILYEAAGELKVAASRGLRDPLAVAASGHVDAAVRSGERQVVTIPDDVRLEGVLADFRPGEVLVFPVTYKNFPLGVVVLAAGGAFSADQRALIDLFLQGLGLALNNAIAHDRLQNLAALDPLTGLYNRRFGLGRLHEEFGRALRVTAPLGVLMLDIDHFKAVNDTYGHLVGDRVLKSVCSIARSSLREGDILLRYGGEELLAVLPAASTEDLRQMGERLRQAVEDSAVSDGEKTVRVTLSAGGAAYPNQNVEHEDGLIRLADEALYRAKDGGRNRVEIAR